MKTVGEILVNARKTKGLSVEKLSDITKIDPEHIHNLESNQYHKLPPQTFIKGFIRNISTVLNLNPNDLVAIFRRDYRTPTPTIVSMPTKKNISRSRFHFGSQFSLGILAFLAFSLYLGFQLRVYLIPPKLSISQPLPQAVVVSPLVVEGITDRDSVIQINQDVLIESDSSGYFIANISLPAVELELKVESTNRFGRTTQKLIPITVLNQ